MASGSAAGSAAAPKSLFSKRIFHEAPIIYTSCHGAYYLDDVPSTEAQSFIVPPHTIIFETSSIGDYTLTPIDEPLWALSQGVHRMWFLRYLSGKFGGVNLEDIDPRLASVIRSIRMYIPGQKIYNRTLTIGGGRSSTVGSARIAYANMGFYRFDVDNPNIARFPDGRLGPGQTTQILQPLRTRMIGDSDIELTYEDVIRNVRAGQKDIEPAIFIFSCCAEASKKYSNTTDEEFNASFSLIENRQREQDLWFLTESPMGASGPGSSAVNVRAAQVAAAAGASAAPAPKPHGYYLRRPQAFAEAFEAPDVREFSELADKKVLDRIVAESRPAAPAEQPPNTKIIYMRWNKTTAAHEGAKAKNASGGASGGAGGGSVAAAAAPAKKAGAGGAAAAPAKKAVAGGAAAAPAKKAVTTHMFSSDGSPYIDSRTFRRMKRDFPGAEFFEQTAGGELVPIAEFAGGRRRRRTQQRRRKNITRRRR